MTLQRLFALSLLCVFISACDTGTPPSSSFEVAAKGLHAGALSDDGQWAIIGSIHHGGSLWRLSDGERLYDWNHQAEEFTTIVAADFSPDSNWAMTADHHTLVLWNVATGKGERFWQSPGQVLDLVLSKDGQYALLGLDDHRAVLFDVMRGGIKHTFTHENRVRSVAMSRDGSTAATASEDYSAALWDIASGEKLASIQHDDDVQLVALSADGQRVMSMGKYDKAVVWDRQGDVLGTIPLQKENIRRGLRFTAAQFGNRNQELLVGRPDQTAQLWDISTMTLKQQWQLPKRDRWKPTSAAVVAINYGPYQDQYYAVASNGFVHELEPQSE